MQIERPIDSYIQLNTVDDAYLIENLSPYTAYIVKSDMHPAHDTPHSIEIGYKGGFGDHLVKGIFWGKAIVANTIIGVTE